MYWTLGYAAGGRGRYRNKELHNKELLIIMNQPEVSRKKAVESVTEILKAVF